MPVAELAMQLARSKMEHAAMPQDLLNQHTVDEESESQSCFVVTADTVCIDSDGVAPRKTYRLGRCKADAHKVALGMHRANSILS